MAGFETDAGIVVEEHVKVIVAGTELVSEDFELAIVVHHGEDVLLEEDEAFARVPDDAAVQVDGLGIAGCVEAAELAGADDFLGEHD